MMGQKKMLNDQNHKDVDQLESRSSLDSFTFHF